MRVLFTGASSAIGGAVLRRLVERNQWEFFCIRHRSQITLDDPSVHVIDIDLASNFDEKIVPQTIDAVIHFAAATHAREPEAYWTMNFEATSRLATAVRRRGCRRFVYISTRCATAGSGAYGESKLAAEDFLKSLAWERLVIIRPSEVYGVNSSEGLDKFIAMARERHVVPMLFGSKAIRFSPLFVDDLVSATVSLIDEDERVGAFEANLCGPEELTGIEVATRLVRAYNALPIPIWWPLAVLTLRLGALLGVNPVEPDQLQRLVSDKTCSTSASNTLKTFYLDDLS